MIRFFNTLSGKIEEFKPLVKGEVKLYTCGPTVYDYAHIGNFRSYMFEDLLKRFLLFKGFKVAHVMNITDVDDKTIKGARELGVTIQEYTDKYIRTFFQDIDTLRISRADHYPRATEHITEMIEIIKGLLAKGYAYEKEGSFYFNITKYPEYGRLSKIDLKELKPGQRVDSDEYEKENVHDFALWKNKKEGEPYWDTDLGSGRPGWHIECSAMSSKYLGETFDIHCGGVDNIFPHHENEIAQSEAYTGKRFVNYWIHCHHLIVDGEKMSKSKGNNYRLKDLLEKGYDPAAVRLILMSTHYRKMLNFTYDALDQAQSSIKRIRDFVYELENRSFKEGENPEIQTIIKEMLQKFDSGLSDDLNISIAVTALYETIKKANILLNKNEVNQSDAQYLLSALKSVDEVLCVLPQEKKGMLDEEILQKIEEREKARAEKNYVQADKIRDELLEQGILLEDTKDGVRWKRVK